MVPPHMPWKQFLSIPGISRMSLNEQIAQYNLYVCEAMMAYQFECGLNGKSGEKMIENAGFLQQEDLFYILQEDGSRIYVTTEN